MRHDFPPQDGAAPGPWQIVSPRHAPPKRGLRVAPVPPKTADLTRPVRGSRNNGRAGRRNRRFDRTKEQSRVSSPCGLNHSSLTVVHPMVGETEQASHTEIRTLPFIILPTQNTSASEYLGSWCARSGSLQ